MRCITGSVVVAVLLSVTSIARARTPVLSLHVPTTADAGASIPFTYGAAGVPRPSRLVMQRQEGSGRVWRTIIRAQPASSSSGQLPALPLGVYRVRLAAFSARGKLLAQRQATLRVFGTVALRTLLAGFRGSTATPYGSEGAYPTATTTFAYVLGLAEYETFSTTHTDPPPVEGTRNHCRSIHIDFLPGAVDGANTSHYAGFVGTFTIVQEVLGPVAASAPYETVGHIDATLEPGRSWAIKLGDESVGTGPSDTYGFFINGSASCDSAAPLYAE